MEKVQVPKYRLVCPPSLKSITGRCVALLPKVYPFEKLSGLDTKLMFHIVRFAGEDIVCKFLENFGGGLRKLESEGEKENFLVLLANFLRLKALELDLMVYFSSYNYEETTLATHLYKTGFGSHIHQGLLPETAQLTYMRHLLDPSEMKKTFPIAPKLSHRNTGLMLQMGGFIVAKIEYFNKQLRQVENNSNEVFFKYLLNAIFCRHQHRWYEAWAYSLSALDASDSSNSSHTDEMMRVYLEMGLSSAQLAISESLSFSKILLEANKYNTPSTVNQFQWVVCLSEMYTSTGRFDDENDLFQNCIKWIPKSTGWYAELVQSHVRAQLEKAENFLAAGLVMFLMTGNITLAPQELEAVKKTANEVQCWVGKIKPMGRMNYYTAVHFGVKAMIKSVSKDKVEMKKLLERALLHLRGAKFRIFSNSILQVAIVNMATFLQTGLFNPVHVSLEFSRVNYAKFSCVCGELFLRTFLINAYCNNKMVETSKLIYLAYEQYYTATMGNSYRLNVLKPLRVLNPTDAQIPQLHQEKTDVGYITMRAIIPAQKSNEFVHYNLNAEQAWCLGVATFEQTTIS